MEMVGSLSSLSRQEENKPKQLNRAACLPKQIITAHIIYTGSVWLFCEILQWHMYFKYCYRRKGSPLILVSSFTAIECNYVPPIAKTEMAHYTISEQQTVGLLDYGKNQNPNYFDWNCNHNY